MLARCTSPTGLGLDVTLVPSLKKEQINELLVAIRSDQVYTDQPAQGLALPWVRCVGATRPKRGVAAPLGLV